MVSKTKRLFAALIDFYVICFLSTSIVGVLTLGKFNISSFSVIVYLIIAFSLLLMKDLLLRDTSVGKWLFKLKVAKTDGTKLKTMDVIKRNLPSVVLLPVEVFLLIINNRRIGDVWAKTLVIKRDGNTGDGSLQDKTGDSSL